jgi:lysophospholipase L1-like esterase
VQLAAARAKASRCDPRIIATTGWTTDELAAAIDAAEPLGQWDLVSLLIGVNNQYRGARVDDYRSEFAALLDRAIAFARRPRDRVLVLSIPDWGVTPFAIHEAATRGDRGGDRCLQRRQARDVRGARRGVRRHHAALAPARREPGQVAEDGLHPSGAMYTTWTQLALPVARTLMAK